MSSGWGEVPRREHLRDLIKDDRKEQQRDVREAYNEIREDARSRKLIEEAAARARSRKEAAEGQQKIETEEAKYLSALPEEVRTQIEVAKKLPASVAKSAKTPEQLQAAAMAKLFQRIAKARLDPAEFIEFAMRTPTGEPIKLTWFHREWLKHMQERSRVLIEAPRSHGKTSIVISYLLWLLGTNPNLRIKMLCQNDSRAKERLYEFRTNLETNQAIKIVFPGLKQGDVGEWTKTKLYVERTSKSKDASFEATGIATSVTGGRCDVLVCDDVCDMRNAILYPSLREDIKQKFHGEILPTLEPNGKVLYIATPYHQHDLTAVLKSNPGWTYKHYGVGNDRDPLAPLWPERWPRKALEDMRVQMGSIEFDRAFKCVAVSGNTVPCRPEWIRYYDSALLGDPNEHICIIGYDLAISQKTTADYFACTTLLYDPNRHLVFVADCYRGRYSFAEQGQRVIYDAQRWQPEKLMIERVGLGGGLESFLKEKAPIALPLYGYYPRGDKQRRFLETTPLFEDGRIFFHPNLDPAKNLMVADRGDLVGELLEFPLGKHDDMVDSFVVAVSGLSDYRVAENEDDWNEGDGTRVRMSVLG